MTLTMLSGLQRQPERRVKWKPMAISGWGRSSIAPVRAFRPEKLSDVTLALQESSGGGVLARGGGRSYGDEAVLTRGHAILTERLNRLVSFDEDTGILVCEAGITFGDLLETFLPRGFLVPVSPGTIFATIGGAIANDVHGKNHETAGSFGDHVLWFDLLTASGDVIRVSRERQPDLFTATVGGLGLTGIILQACLRLQRCPSPAVVVTEQRLPDIDAYLEAMAASRDATYSVGWIDAVATGRRLGRGILQTAEYGPADAQPATVNRSRAIPFDFPSAALNRHSVRLFNIFYHHRVPRRGRSRIVPIRKFLYPLDNLLNYNRIYGRRGFYQFQCVVPPAASRAGVRKLVEAISANGDGSFLAVIKLLGREGHGDLSFPMEGCTLALDFPKTLSAQRLLHELEAIVLDHGGRIYLAKDALLRRSSFERMYPKHRHLAAVLSDIDPLGRFTSDMARRLGLRPAEIERQSR